jgi:hypothetical protein
VSEIFQSGWLPEGAARAPAGDAGETKRRSALLRRLRVLLYAGCAAFTLATWMLVTVQNPLALVGLGPGPSSVARAHLDALRRGELRAAYDLFSTEYRQQVSFEAYHKLVVTHQEMFETISVTFQMEEDSGNHAVLEGRITSADGEHYRARFTMVRVDGRWWIDDLRWGLDEDEPLVRT